MSIRRTRAEDAVNRLARNARIRAGVHWATTKTGYRLLSRALAKDDVLFLNLGYEEDPPMALSLGAADEPDRYPIQLYHRVGTQVDLKGKDVLEVSCGHGGGASYLTRTLHPARYTGLDLNNLGVEFCRRRHTLPGLDFVQGTAERLPFPDESFDALVNVEAGLHYLDFPRFVDEVVRVLRPGGHFLYADLRDADAVAAWENTLAAAALTQVDQRGINAEVLRGLEKNRLVGQITRRLPFGRRIATAIAGGPGSLGYRRLSDNEIVYRMYCFTK
ncbi:phthiotriol/phenolphthiotriol dimycocerosates methyltransferase [Mycobacterium sp.]|uniref:phthiotriol/phenolphthiotriol dimycocerosates methyltransferase n=1 Tax=Mycobacterium sp. TaxID=1785 RepID=UPI003A86A8AD